MNATRGLRDYAVVTASYQALTLTDGALRTLVLFHLYGLGRTPLEVVSLFLSYEVFGIVTNLAGGVLAARFGLRSTLLAGLLLQVLACGLLAAVADAPTVPLVMAAQALSGVAKDLTKTSAKSWVRLVAPPGDGRALLRLVALLTGSKNAMKGVGLLLGGVLLETAGFRGANVAMAAVLAVAAAACGALLPAAAGRTSERVALRDVFAADARVHWLAAARLFLFGSRDAWFVFALPVFLATDLGWSAAGAAAFLACWVIGYGILQAVAPAWLGRHAGRGAGVTTWTLLLLAPLLGTAGALHFGLAPGAALVPGLFVYGALFASGSALHSWLVVHQAAGERVALNVGLYYAANAAGRLLGTLLSGAVFEAAGAGTTGLVACLGVAALLVLLSALASLPLHAAARGSPAPSA